MSYAEHPPAAYLVRWGDLWKAGFTTRRRWRTFETRGAELVGVWLYAAGPGAVDIEQELDRWLRQQGHQAFARKADAVPFLGGRGAGWVECVCLCSPDASPHPIAWPSHHRSVMRLALPSLDATPTGRDGTNGRTTHLERASYVSNARVAGEPR